jgi:nucleotide-binding universal stress UspA family protein
MFKKILVPIDGGNLSDAAIKAACAFAKETGARLIFYYAKPGYCPAYVSGEMVMGDFGIDTAFMAAMDKQAQALLAAAAQTASDMGVAYETLSTECDTPYEGIIEAAEDQVCDLIFMASHGRRGVSALLLGSETQRVLTHSKIPVLIYR